jgi:catalase
MASRSKHSKRKVSSNTAKAASRNSQSRPAKAAPAADDDALARLAEEQNAIAAEFPFNRTKAQEHGREHAVNPAEGDHHPLPSVQVGASSLSESNDSGKSGPAAQPGVNQTVGPLARARADGTNQPLTTNQGVRVADNQNSLKAGLRGPTLLEDFILREKITHFDHERIPERIVHARGSGAHGFFENYKSLKKLTRAAPFQQEGLRTPVFVRFSTVAGERGSVDTARDARGFAVKFYTHEGNWDLVGNNIPVFFIQDAMKFPDLVHAVKPEPHHAMPQAASAHDTFWDFISLMPESTHMMMWVMSDRAIPRSYRMMQGFGVHTFRLVNEAGESVLCKFHWSPKQGTYSLVWDEAVKIAGADADFHRRDLWEAIEAGAYPEWELALQIFTDEQADRFSFDVLDPTKIVPEELVPLTPVGRLVLNRNPDNFFAETEQVAFCVAHIVPGIDFTNDPLLAGRIHSYVDTQISRLGGANFHELPINAPLAPVSNNQRDGMHRQAVHRGRVAYEPNSLSGGCPYQAGAKGFVAFPQPLQEGRQGVDKLRGKPEKFAEHYNQAALFYNSQTEVEKAHIVGGFRFELSKVTVPAIRKRMVASLRNASEELARRVAEGLGIELPEPLPRVIGRVPKAEAKESSFLSLRVRLGQVGAQTRRVAILIADGVEEAPIAQLQATLLEAGAVPRLLGVQLGAYETAEGTELQCDATFENTPMVLFDALMLPSGKLAVERLAKLAHVAEFIQLAYRHGKAILALGESRNLLEANGVAAQMPDGKADAGVILGGARESPGLISQFIQAIQQHRQDGRDRNPPRV